MNVSLDAQPLKRLASIFRTENHRREGRR